MDYILFAILLLYMLRGWQKGGYYILFSLIETAFCMLAAYLLSDVLQNCLEKVGFLDICQKITNKFVDKFNYQLSLEQKVKVSIVLGKTVSFLIIYTVARWIVWWLKKVCKRQNKRVCSVGNSLVGVLVGGIKGCLVFFVVYSALNAISIVSSNENLANLVVSAPISNSLMSVFKEKIISVFLFY